jgi:hypothetical protein
VLFTRVVLPGAGAQMANQGRDLKPGSKDLFTAGYPSNAIIQQGRLSARQRSGRQSQRMC